MAIITIKNMFTLNIYDINNIYYNINTYDEILQIKEIRTNKEKNKAIEVFK